MLRFRFLQSAVVSFWLHHVFSSIGSSFILSTPQTRLLLHSLTQRKAQSNTQSASFLKIHPSALIFAFLHIFFFLSKEPCFAFEFCAFTFCEHGGCHKHTTGEAVSSSMLLQIVSLQVHVCPSKILITLKTHVDCIRHCFSFLSSEMCISSPHHTSVLVGRDPQIIGVHVYVKLAHWESLLHFF